VPGKINHVRISVLVAAEPRGGFGQRFGKVKCCGKYYSVVEEVIVY